jgi:twitching motility two-component system response regulator PilH
LTYVNGQVTFAISPLIRGISLARKILLADDSVTAQNMGRKILADAGYEIIAVNNGSAALKKIAELKPDLVILDVYMPGYSGLEVCQRLKESQETARIPVLLSVGKLEPFKPEEAQRVGADAFIVKPFEASELLSALSKLEDRVVPRAEASKSGRFARAMAAVEEADRSRNERGTDEGWKSRLAMPHAKTEPEEKVADEASIYNPVNRDLRTVVEKPAENAAAGTKEEKRQLADEAAPTVAVSALVQSGLPKDVTPEEVAAIAAAAAKIQLAGAVEHSQVEQSQPVSESQASGNLETATSGVAESAPSLVDFRSEIVAPAEAKIESERESKAEIPVSEPIAAPALVTQSEVRESQAVAEDAQDEPVTMAATAESVAATRESRWTAVSIALNAEESAVSLDQEMQKAQADSAGADSGAPAAVPAEQNVASQAAVADTGSAVESPAAEIPNFEIRSVPEFVPAVVAQSETAVTASLVSPEAAIVPEAAQVVSEEKSELVPPATVVSEAEPVAAAEALVANHEVPVSEAPVAVRAEFAAGNGAQNAAESKLDPETVKNTAAAWASWRETRDIGKGSDMPVEAGEAQSNQSEAAPAEVAMAVAAGAEQILQEVSAATSSEKPTDVASIVESVLADLRPKLMEEISRKMALKK